MTSLQFFNREDSIPEGELDLLPMFKRELLHEGFWNVESSFSIPAYINPPDILGFHCKRNTPYIINLFKSLQSRKDYILNFPYRYVRSDMGWVVS